MNFFQVFLLTLTILQTAFKNAASEICGQRSGLTGTIFGGVEVKKNSWPWIVALFNRPKEKFFCAGSLISQNHILSGT